jgi:uncharacterized phiE125 gp8 family phage protein
MTLRIVTEPAAEPLTVAEVMAWSKIDSSNQEPAPGAVTVALAAPAAPGNVDNGAHRYLATFTTAAGETQAGTVSAAVTVADKTVNGKVALSGIPIGGALVTGRKLYRTIAGGTVYMLLATLADNTTTVYTDNVADAGLGAGAPNVNTAGDPLLAMLITAARRVAERDTGRALITQTWELVLDAFPCKEIELDLLPVQSIASVKYYDENGDLQTVDPAEYVLDTEALLSGWVLPSDGNSWPATRRVANAVAVRFAAGYGAAGASVPAEIRSWICAQVAAAYRSPEGLMAGNAVALPFIDRLLDTYRRRAIV